MFAAERHATPVVPSPAMPEGTHNTDELLRLIGRELEAINRNTARAANTLGWLLGITLVGIALAVGLSLGAN